MPSFNFDIGDLERVGSRFLSDVRDELQRALATEKATRKITQQQIAEKLGTSRAVINRQITGLENIGIKRVAEILWAIGWEPHFGARRIPDGENQYLREHDPKPLDNVVLIKWNNPPPPLKPGERVETRSSR
jgi:DNA-binding Lrp family transcriptional regulator